MSYILDALKKADAERKLGAVPNIHAQPAPVMQAPGRHRARNAPWPWVALAAFAVIAIGLAWFKPWQAAPVPPPAAQSVPVVVAAAPAIKTKPTAAAEPQTPSVKPKANPAPAKKAPPHRKPAPAPASEEPLVTLRELPENIQREIPAITVNGYIFSSKPADRSVLINKKLLHEGDQVAPDLTLEKMTQGGMVLNYKGYRYRTSY